MVPSKFGVNWPFGSGEEAKNRFSRWRPWRPSWISDRNDFSYFWSTSHPDASYQVSSQLAQGYRRSRLLKQLLTPHDGRRTTHDGRRTTDDGHWLTTIAHHEHFVLRWAKKKRKKMGAFKRCILLSLSVKRPLIFWTCRLHLDVLQSQCIHTCHTNGLIIRLPLLMIRVNRLFTAQRSVKCWFFDNVWIMT